MNKVKDLINKWQKLDVKPNMNEYVQELEQIKALSSLKTKKIFKIKNNDDIKT